MLVKVIGSHGGLCPGSRLTSFLVDGKILIDAGSVAEGIPIAEQSLINHILISHPHLDHIRDLGFLCDNCFGLKKKPFEVYTNSEVKEAITNHLMNDLIWPDFSKIPSAEKPTMRFHEIEVEEILKLGTYKVLPIYVHHFCHAMGFIIEKGDKAILFTQDTGPTERIWEIAAQYKNLKAIFTEVSFPNAHQKVADLSRHHTPKSLAAEIKKMPADIPIFVGHIKPGFQDVLYQEISDLDDDRITVLGSDSTTFSF